MVLAGPLYLMNGKINQVLLTKAAARPLPQIILQDQMSTSKVIFHAISPYCITKLAIQYVYVHFLKKINIKVNLM